MLNGCIVWHRADRVTLAGNRTSSARNLVGGLGDFVIAPTEQPLYVANAWNGRPSLEYDGAQRMTCQIPPFAGGEPLDPAISYTFFCVSQTQAVTGSFEAVFETALPANDPNSGIYASFNNISGVTTEGNFFFDSAANNDFATSSPVISPQPVIRTGIRNGTTQQMHYYENGVLASTPTNEGIRISTYANPQTLCVIGGQTLLEDVAFGSAFFTGQLFELILVNRPLANFELDLVHGYLAQRYVIPVGTL